ncbi:hypothetical protein GCM10027258_14060 [Amycolatopsis stemonae]
MTDQTGGDQPQKTVAELLAQHGAQVDGGRRRRRRAADDDDEPGTPEAPPGATGSHRRPGVGDTGPQAIIDRVASEGTPPPPSRPAGRRRAEPPSPPPPAPRAVPQDSQPLPRPVPPPPPPPARPAPGGAESGQYARPAPQESGQYARPQESGQFSRPPQEPPAPPQASQQLPVPPRAPRRQPPPPQPSQQLPAPPPAAEETRGAVPPVRRRPGPPPQASQQLPTPPPAGGPLSARLDGLNGTPDAEADVPPGPMASGTFATPPAAPGRPRRAPARRPQPQQEAYTEQFSAVPDEEPPAPPKKADEPSSPAGLANWRKRRQKEQMEDTEIGVMPVVPTETPDDGYPEDDFEPDGFAPESSGYQAAYDAGPPTGAYPPPMPFAPGDRASRTPIPDDLEPYEREFADGYPADGPDFEHDEYGYEDDEYDDVPPEPVAAEEPETSPGKAWLALAGQLAMGVVGGAAVWLGFNWLWVNIPAAALVAALLVVVALVWIVRKIRRAEDLQTTVLAVLVGLVVTVSPAALLLVGR